MKKETKRHSLSHILAAAVQELFPGTKFGIGPAIENGFYYDFNLPESLSPKDLPKIEEKMKELIKKNIVFKKKVVSKREAKKLFKDQLYKLELINEARGKISIYESGDFVDLCKGPHVRSTKQINPEGFCLTKIAGAYWKGSERKPMLTRIYGIAFESKGKLEDYLKLQEEAEERDHRKLGKKLDLFQISEEVGPGLVIWHPKLSVVREEIENYWKKEHKKRGYQYIYSPHIGKKALWEKSGHWKFYRDMMYSPMDIEGVEYLIKPMNCPFHVQVYKSEIRSYRDLPIRYCELGTVYRFEPSGTLHGLTRVRGFTQDDSHIFCRPDQLQEEVIGVLDLALKILSVFGFEEYKIDLSLRDPKHREKFMGRDEIWRKAEKGLEQALKERKVEYNRAIGEAVFYGPKIDISLLDALGRTWQCTTIQVDFNFPEKFDLNYVDKKGKKRRVVMVHRTILGSVERFLGCLIEHYAGALPLWLSPIQISVIPVGSRHKKYAREIGKILEEKGLRVKVRDEAETVSKKIREGEIQKIPYMLVVGDKETKTKSVRVRQRGKGDIGVLKLEKFIKKVEKQIEKRI